MTELGERFKQEREAKGLSLNHLQDMTKIQKRYLVGIEEGNYTMMPGKFYVRAFIKQYAEALDLDPDEIFEQYKNDIPTTYNEDLPEQLSRVQSRKSLSGGSKILDFLPKLLIGLIVIGAIVLVWYWMVQSAGEEESDQVNQGNNPVNIEEPKDIIVEDENAESDATEDENSAEANEETEKEEPADEQEKPAQKMTVAENNGSSTVYELTEADTFELEVVSTGATWVSVKNGAEKTLFEKTLQKGDTETMDFTNETEAFLRIGNVPGTELYINGEKLEYAVPPNERTTQNITIRYTKSE